MSFLRKRRGVSGIISGLFLVAVAVMVFNVLAWQFFQYDAYHQIVLERDQREWERFNERIAISDIAYGFKYLRFEVSNVGAVTGHVVDVWLNDTTVNSAQYYALAGYIASNTSAWVNSGSVRWMNTTISLTNDHVYYLKIATERGNIAIAPKFKQTSQTPTGEQKSPFIFSFLAGDFQYIYGTETWSTQRGGWLINQGNNENPVFRLKLTNGYQSTVRLKSSCVLNFVWFDPDKLPLNPGNPATLSVIYRCFILKPGSIPSNAQAYDASNPQTFGAGQSDYVYYGAQLESQTGLNKLDNKGNGDVHIFVAMFYTIDGDLTGTVFGATVAIIAARQQL